MDYITEKIYFADQKMIPVDCFNQGVLHKYIPHFIVS